MPHASWGGPGLSREQLERIVGIGGIPLYVRREIEPLAQALVQELPEARKPGAAPLTSAGGYNKRRIDNSSVWSNHSWGLALDVNPATNPYSYTFRTDFIPGKARALAAKYGFRWGGDYRGKKDPMHFEFMGSVAEARNRVARLSPVSVAYGEGAKGQKVLELEMRLSLLGHNVVVDGVYDAKTRAGILAFQKQAFPGQPKEHDGIAGARTIAALEHAAIPVALRTPPRDWGSVLPPGSTLLPGDRMSSPDKTEVLLFQQDGNVVTYSDGKASWSTGVRGNRLVFQAEGNFVLYLDTAGKTVPAWHTNTHQKGARLALQDDGNFVVYNAGNGPVWDAGSAK